MSEVTIGLIVALFLIFLLGIGLPIALTMIIVSFLGVSLILNLDVAWAFFGSIPYEISSNWVLSSVPMFLFMGFICYHTKLTESLFEAARVILGRVPGGLASATVLGTSGFAAVSGSSLACSAAMSRIAIPEMLKAGYSKQLASGTVAVSGTIGALIPPSIIMILYGVITQTSINSLFAAGIVVGLLTALTYIVAIIFQVTLGKGIDGESYVDNSTPALRKIFDVWPVLIIMFGIFYGLFSGIFTPTEAGAVGAGLSCIAALMKRTLTWSSFKLSVKETVVTTGSLLIIVVGASMLSKFFAISGISDAVSDLVFSVTDNKFAILVGIAIVYLLLGLFLEPVGAMLLTLPVMMPIADGLGIDYLWFGIFVIKLLEIGLVTPPVGMNVFVIKNVLGDLIELGTIFKGVAWFLMADLILIIGIVVFPDLVTFLPNLLKG